jgi:hypothetical protein
LNKWPVQLRPVVQQHGEQAVEHAAMEVLGYPAALIHTTVETIKVVEFLNSK